MIVRRFSAPVALALALGLCTAPAAHADRCSGGDPVHDPGGTQPCSFVVSVANSGAEAVVRGRFVTKTPVVEQPSYVKDLADDGLDAHLYARLVKGGTASEHLVATASGPGAMTEVNWIGGDTDAFYLRVCVGPGTTDCSAWSG